MGEKRGERQLVADNTKGTMIQMTEKGIYLKKNKKKNSRSLFPPPSSETDQGGEAADMTSALIPFPTQQVHETRWVKTWGGSDGEKAGKGGDLESPLGGLNGVEGAQN